MSDLPFTNDDEREWVDGAGAGRVGDVDDGITRVGSDEVDDTDGIDSRVLSEASEFDAVEQRRGPVADDDEREAGFDEDREDDDREVALDDER